MFLVIVGQTKIPYNDLFLLNRNEIDAILEGHMNDKRLGAFWSLIPNLKQGASIERTIPLPWDKPQFDLGNIEDIKAGLKRAKEIFAKHGKVRN